MPMFKRQAVVLLVLTALALGVTFYLWPETGQTTLAGRQVSVPAQEKIPGENRPAVKTNASSGQITPGGRLVVFVSGAVKQPGVFELPAGSRAEDAVKAAGGFGALADPQKLNLARPLTDGEEIKIPSRAEGAGADNTTAAAGTAAGGKAGALGTVRLNTATEAELETLPGIGPSLAKRITDYRSRNGAFQRVEDIQAVPGIGAGRFKQIKDRLAL